MTAEKRNLIDELNRCMPAANHAGLGTLLEELITQHNALCAAHTALCAKLDDDGTVTDTNYEALHTADALVVDSLTVR